MRLFIAGVALMVFGLLVPSPRTDINVPAGTDINLLLKTAVAGNTYIVDDGTFSGGIWVSEKNGTPLARITLKAAHPGMVIFKGSTATRSDVFSLYKSSNWTVEGIVFDGGETNGLKIHAGSDFPIVRNCEFRNNGASGLLTGTVNGLLIEDCRFHDQLTPTSQHGCYISGKSKDGIVRRNQFWKNNQAGLQMNSQGSGGVVTGMTVQDCSFWSNGETIAAATINCIGVTNSVFSGLSLSDNKAGNVSFIWNGVAGGESAGNTLYACSITSRPGTGRACIAQTKGTLSVTACRMWPANTVVDPISVLGGAVVTQAGNVVLPPMPVVAIPTPDPGPVVP